MLLQKKIYLETQKTDRQTDVVGDGDDVVDDGD